MDLGFWIVMVGAGEGSVKIVPSGISRKCVVCNGYFCCVFTCKILLMGW